MVENSEIKMSRRRALMRVGLLSLGAYSVPAVTAMSYAVVISEPEPTGPTRPKSKKRREERSGPSSPRRADNSPAGCGSEDGVGCTADTE